MRGIIALFAATCVIGTAAAQDAKPVVAVERIDDPTGQNVGGQLLTMIESAVAATGRFQAECQRQQGGTVRRGARGKTTGCTAPPIDYSIYGGITTAQTRPL